MSGGGKSLAAALRASQKADGGSTLKVLQLYGDDEETLAEIQSAYLRGVGCKGIARVLSAHGPAISDDSVSRYLESIGVKK